MNGHDTPDARAVIRRRAIRAIAQSHRVVQRGRLQIELAQALVAQSQQLIVLASSFDSPRAVAERAFATHARRGGGLRPPDAPRLRVLHPR